MPYPYWSSLISFKNKVMMVAPGEWFLTAYGPNHCNCQDVSRSASPTISVPLQLFHTSLNCFVLLSRNTPFFKRVGKVLSWAWEPQLRNNNSPRQKRPLPRGPRTRWATKIRLKWNPFNCCAPEECQSPTERRESFQIEWIRRSCASGGAEQRANRKLSLHLDQRRPCKY